MNKKQADFLTRLVQKNKTITFFEDILKIEYLGA